MIERNTPPTLLPAAATAAVIATLLTAAITPPPLHAQSRFESMDVFQLEYAADPQISPDGGQVVYVRTSMDIMRDRKRSELWIIDADGSDHRRLGEGGSPRWSPDGTRLAYTAGGQIHLRWMDTGETAALTQLTESPGGLRWSPDGQHIAFNMLVPYPPPSLAAPPRPPAGADWADPPIMEDRFKSTQDGVGYLDFGYNHIFVIPVDGGTPTQVTSGDFHHSSAAAWHPDGTHLVFSSNRNPDWVHDYRNSELYTASVPDRRGPRAHRPPRPRHQPGRLSRWPPHRLHRLRGPHPHLPGQPPPGHERRRQRPARPHRRARPQRLQPRMGQRRQRPLLPVRRRRQLEDRLRHAGRRHRGPGRRPGRHIVRPPLRRRLLLGRQRRHLRAQPDPSRHARRTRRRQARGPGRAHHHEPERRPAREQDARRGRGDLVGIVLRRPPGSGLDRQAARLRRESPLSPHPGDPRRAGVQLRRQVLRRDAAAGFRRLRRALRQPEGEHKLRARSSATCSTTTIPARITTTSSPASMR